MAQDLEKDSFGRDEGFKRKLQGERNKKRKGEGKNAVLINRGGQRGGGNRNHIVVGRGAKW